MLKFFEKIIIQCHCLGMDCAPSREKEESSPSSSSHSSLQVTPQGSAEERVTEQEASSKSQGEKTPQSSDSLGKGGDDDDGR